MSFELVQYTDPSIYGYSGSGISLEDIELHEDNEVIIERLSQYFRKEVFDYTRKNSVRDSRAKARSLLLENYSESGILSQYNYQKGRERAIKEAISNGYIVNITVKKPWHPRIFLDESKIYTYFLQHEYVVLYSGQKKHIFFSEQGKQDLLESRGYDYFNNAGSILGQGFLARDEGNRFTDEKQTYYTTEPSNAKSYGMTGDPPLYDASVILEVCVPRSLPKYQVKHGAPHNSVPNIDSLKKMNEFFGSPKGHIPSYYYVEFHIRERLPLDYIMRVWDLEKTSNEPHFMPLNEYARVIKRDFPSRVPNLGNTNLQAPESPGHREDELQTIEVLEEIEEEYLAPPGKFMSLYRKLERLKNSSQSIVKSIRNIMEMSSGISEGGRQYRGGEKILDSLLSEIENYNKKLEEIVELLNKIGHTVEVQTRKAEDLKDIHELAANNLKTFKRNEDELDRLEEEVKKKEKDIENLKRDIVKSKIPEDKLRSNLDRFKSIESARPEMLVESQFFIDVDEQSVIEFYEESRFKSRDELREIKTEAKKGLEALKYVAQMEEALEEAESILEKNSYRINSKDEYLSLYTLLEKSDSASGSQYSYALKMASLKSGLISTHADFRDWDRLKVTSSRKMTRAVESYLRSMIQNSDKLENLKSRFKAIINELDRINEEIISCESEEREQEIVKEMEELEEELNSEISELREFISGFDNIILKRERILANENSSREAA